MDQRSSRRFPFRAATPVEVVAPGAGDGAPRAGPVTVLVNISPSGLQLVAEREMAVGDDYDLRVHLPLFARPLEVRGKVVWCRPVDGGRFRSGVRFEEVSGEVAEKLRSLADDAHLRNLQQSDLKEENTMTKRPDPGAPAVILLLLASAAAAWGQERLPAKESIPYARIGEPEKSDVRWVMEGASIRLRLPTRRVHSSTGVYCFLLDRLDLTSRVVRGFGLGSYKIVRLNQKHRGGPRGAEPPSSHFRIDDGEGSAADVQPLIVERTDKGKLYRRIYLALGYFGIPLIGRVHGRGVIVLEYRFDDKGRLKTWANLYFRVESRFLNRVSRFLRFVLERIVMEKCGLFIKAARQVSRLVHEQPLKVWEKIKGDAKVLDVDRREFRRRFVDSRRAARNRPAKPRKGEKVEEKSSRPARLEGDRPR